MSNEEIKRAILEMDEREELAKDMLEQVSPAVNQHSQNGLMDIWNYPGAFDVETAGKAPTVGEPV